MIIETVVTTTTLTVACDGPALGTNCQARPIETTTEAALLGILRGQGWRLPDVNHDGRIDRASPCYCRDCRQALEAAGKLGPQ